MTLMIALLALVAWIVLTFILPVGIGAVHLLLGLATALLVRWWALRPVSGER
jgi:hypothetical protein